jgi:splicing factor 3B subunit 2
LPLKIFIEYLFFIFIYFFIERRPTKNEKRRLRKKQGEKALPAASTTAESKNGQKEQDTDDDVQVEYVAANIDHSLFAGDPALDQFKSIFERFAKPEELTNSALTSSAAETSSGALTLKTQQELEAADADEPKKLSKKKKKLMSRLSVAELKQLVQRPDVVEAHDVSSSDPRLLVFLKAYRNSVPVPRHWCHKRKYLQGKRGIEKPPFQLPEFIADTGISKIRQSVMEQEALKKSKQRARDRVQPKMGKIDIDYQVLHDAFFKYQKKPKLSGHGDLYYEGKENEVNDNRIAVMDDCIVVRNHPASPFLHMKQIVYSCIVTFIVHLCASSSLCKQPTMCSLFVNFFRLKA